MADKVTKWTPEAMNLKDNIIEDIIKRVSDLKQIAKELEDTKMMLKMNTETKIVKMTNQKKKDDKMKSKSRKLVECHLCDKKFQIISDLENHIKTSHEDSETYNCDKCKKKFVTKWRLEKHGNLHSNIYTRQCKYFRNQTKCPFDELGCKFRHDTNTNESVTTKNDSTKLSEYSFNMLSTIYPNSWSVTSDDNSSFYTSTPRKCEECMDKSQCVECIVIHTLGQHGVARVLFS